LPAVYFQPGADFRGYTKVMRAPDVARAGRARSYASEAGEATHDVEARDSETGAIIGGAVDRRLAGENSILSRNQVSHRSEFRNLVHSGPKRAGEPWAN
jgi:hypothetical protein